MVPSGFLGICQGRDPFCMLCEWCDNSLVYHVLKRFFSLFPTFNQNFSVGMVNRGYGVI